MRTLGLGSAFKQANSWTCTTCLQQSQRAARPFRHYSTRSNRIPLPKKKGRIFFAAATGALGVTGLAFTDDIKHAYKAVERTGRVVGTLFVCINEWVHTEWIWNYKC
jgi:aarF domain-containing kinase